jgi:hypothetical protein
MSAPHVHPHGELHNPDTAHESADISMRAIVSFAILLTVVTITIQVAMYGVFHVLARVESASDPEVSPLATPANEAPSEPRLQTTPWADLKTLRIPIDRAKELLLQKGLAVRQGPVDPSEGTSIAATGESTGGRNLPAGGADTSTAPTGASGAHGASDASSPLAATPKKPGGGQ